MPRSDRALSRASGRPELPKPPTAIEAPSQTASRCSWRSVRNLFITVRPTSLQVLERGGRVWGRQVVASTGDGPVMQ
ncbi:hypothetical protein ACFFX0_21860 [Citricoccus parietis]|uniref:Uncharacterized protein n=1 Tax=Citricoccus parietis TaxID=592307 RepID=A0ABV5G447_9MICC